MKRQGQPKSLLRNTLKVMVFTPPLDQSGGIGALFTYAKPFFPKDVEVTFVDTRGYGKNPFSSAFPFLRALFKLLNYGMRKKIDVVHLNLGARGSSYRKTLIASFAICIFRIPTIFQLHASAFENFVLGLNPILRGLIISVLNKAQLILLLGTESMEMMKRIGVNPQILKIFQMGVPNLHAQPSQKANNLNLSKRNFISSPVLLFAGEIGARKGLPEILNTFSELREVPIQLIIAGSGDTSKWQQFCNDSGIQNRIAFVGPLNYLNIHSYLRDVDGLILASKAEGLPVSVLECLSAQKVAVSTMVGNLGDFLNSENSIVVKETSTEAIREAIAELIRLHSVGELEKIAIKGRQLWTNFFNVEKTTSTLVQIWRSAANERSTSHQRDKY